MSTTEDSNSMEGCSGDTISSVNVTSLSSEMSTNVSEDTSNDSSESSFTVTEPDVQSHDKPPEEATNGAAGDGDTTASSLDDRYPLFITSDEDSEDHYDVQENIDSDDDDEDAFISNRLSRRYGGFDIDSDMQADDSNDSSATSSEDSAELLKIKSEVEANFPIGGFNPDALRDFHPVTLLNNREHTGCILNSWASRRKMPVRIDRAFYASPALIGRLRLQDRYPVHMGCVNALNFNQSGNMLASGSDDRNVVITDWMSGKQIYKFKTGHRMNVFEVKFLPESGDLQVVTCSRDCEVRLCVLSTTGVCRTTRSLMEHKDACHKLCLPRGEPSVVISAGEDGRVNLCDIREDRSHKLLRVSGVPLYSISSNPVKSSEFIVSGKDEFARVYDRRMLSSESGGSAPRALFCAPNLRPSRTPPSTNNSATVKSTDDNASVNRSDTSLEVTPKNGSSDNTLTSSQSQEDVSTPPLDDNSDPEDDSSDAALSSARRRIFRGICRPPRVSANFNITSVAYSYNGAHILASYNDEDIYLFDATDSSKEPLHKYQGHRNMQTVKSVNFFGPHSEYVVSGSDDGFIYIWDRETTGLVQWLYGDECGVVNVVEPHPVFPVLATSGLDNDVKIWSPLGLSPDARPLLKPSSSLRECTNSKTSAPTPATSPHPKLHPDSDIDVEILKTRVARNWLNRRNDTNNGSDAATLMDLMRVITNAQPGLFRLNDQESDDEDNDAPSSRRRRIDESEDVNHCHTS